MSPLAFSSFHIFFHFPSIFSLLYKKKISKLTLYFPVTLFVINISITVSEKKKYTRISSLVLCSQSFRFPLTSPSLVTRSSPHGVSAWISRRVTHVAGIRTSSVNIYRNLISSVACLCKLEKASTHCDGSSIISALSGRRVKLVDRIKILFSAGRRSGEQCCQIIVPIALHFLNFLTDINSATEQNRQYSTFLRISLIFNRYLWDYDNFEA